MFLIENVCSFGAWKCLSVNKIVTMNKEEFLKKLKKIKLDDNFTDSVSKLIDEMGNCYAAGALNSEIENYLESNMDDKELLRLLKLWANWDIWREDKN